MYVPMSIHRLLLRSLLRLLLIVTVLLGGCAHLTLSGKELDRIQQPAFVSRIEENAGPQALVFREDGRYRPKLKKLEPREADRRLVLKLQKGITRFELSDRLRVATLKRLPEVRPWTRTVDPARVATVLESYLVDEVPANLPDFDLLKPLGADTVVEIVIEAYGLKSEKGSAYAFLEGHARLFRLDNGAELWRTRFSRDGKTEERPGLDPLMVARDPERFRLELVELVDGLAEVLAAELSPKDRASTEPSPEREDLKGPPEDPQRTGQENLPKRGPSSPKGEDPLGPGELPAPDSPP